MNEIYLFGERAKHIQKQTRELKKELKDFLHGKTITITDPHYNGQPYGNSKKPLKGHSWIYDKDKIGTGNITLNDDEIIICPPFGQLYMKIEGYSISENPEQIKDKKS